MGVNSMALLVFAILLASTVYAKQSLSLEVTPRVSKIVEASNAFALELYQTLKHDTGPDENLFFSPSSISTALAMTYLGSRGKTATQLAKVLHFDQFNETGDLHQAFKDLNALLFRGGSTELSYTLKSANRLYGHKGYKFLEDYLDNTSSYYGARLETVDFIEETEESRRKINSWVEKQTAGKITDLLPEGSINGLVKLILVNAIYFKADWADKFDVTNTKKKPFFLSNAPIKTVETPMMIERSVKYKYGFSTDLDSKVLELPYKDGHLSMIVILPNEIDGLAEVENKLNIDILDRLTAELPKRKVWVSLPKFKFSQGFGLVDTLNQLGIEDLFKRGAADLSGISGEKDLFVSKMFHKAFIDVNEEGSEAAAATGMMMEATSFQPVPQFRADHPFLFLIRENFSGTVLFLGRLVKPADESTHDEL